MSIWWHLEKIAAMLNFWVANAFFPKSDTPIWTILLKYVINLLHYEK